MEEKKIQDLVRESIVKLLPQKPDNNRPYPELLEMGALRAVEIGQLELFDRYFKQLKIYYIDWQSPNKNHLLGLNLLRLLSQNRLAEFHTEVELLHPDIIQSDPFIKHPVLLEQYLMEGSYNKVFLAKTQVPSPHYTFFVDVLLNTIREEVASCLETAFDSIAVGDAARLLFLNNLDELKKFITIRRWVISSDSRTISFPTSKEMSQHTAKVASQQIASQIIEYAVELEKIV